MIASLPCMQWLTTPIPRRPAGPATVSIPVTWTATGAGGAGVVRYSQTSACGASKTCG